MTLKQTMAVRSRWTLSAVCLLLVFGVGSASAQDNICGLQNFCDRDGDTLIRDHKKCTHCKPGEPRDCDDSDPTNACDGGTSVEYTAELKGGFVFTNLPNAANVRVMNMSPNSEGDRLLSAEPAWMFRPLVGFCSSSNEIECNDDTDCPPGETCVVDPGQNTWDTAFEDVCPGLGGFLVQDIFATPDRWSIIGNSGVRMSLRDFRLDVDGEQWEIWIQLIGIDDPAAPFLPPVGGEPSVFSLPTVSMWGKPVNKKGRSSDCIGGPLPQAPLSTPSVLTITAKAP